MIGVASHHRVEEDKTEAPDAADLAGELKPEEPCDSPLAWYLAKLLEPGANAPHEPAPPADDRDQDETEEPPPLVTPDHPGARDDADASEKARPLWQIPAADLPDLPSDAGNVHAVKAKPALRSYARKEKAAGGRQKLMLALIPVLVVVLVALVKNPLSARATAPAAVAPPVKAARPIVTDLDIAWTVPAPYEPRGRDPMRPTPAAAVAGENAEPTARSTEPPVDLMVTGILYSDDRPTAIIGTQVVREGQQIFGATVEKIDTDGVQFERNGRRWKQAVNR